MNIPVHFDKGDGAIEHFDGERVRIDASRPSAPGSRLAFRMPPSAPAPGMDVHPGGNLMVKVHRCVRIEQRFTIEGRFVNLTRAMRNELQVRLRDLGEPSEQPPEAESIERRPSD